MDSKLLNYAKSPIPILNNSSPHNYAIMSALLSNIDSSPPIARNKSNSKQQSQPNSSYFQNTISSADCAETQPISNRNNQMTCQPKETEKDSNKELVYATKQLHIQQKQHVHQQQQQQQQIVSSLTDSLQHCIDMCDVTSNNFIDHGAPFTEYFRMPAQRIDQSIADPTLESILVDENNNHHPLMDNNKKQHSIDNFQASFSSTNSHTGNTYVNSFVPDKPHKNLVCLQESSSFLDNTTSNKSSKKDTGSSFINSPLDSEFCHLNQEQDFFNSQEMFSEKSLTAPKCQETPVNKQTVIQPEEATTADSNMRNTVHNEVVTYTISCPAEWQQNLDRMVNCFVLFKDLNKTSCLGNDNVTLKCSVCQLVFYTLSGLRSHKEINELCRNDMTFANDLDEVSDSGSFVTKKKNRKREPTSISFLFEYRPGIIKKMWNILFGVRSLLYQK